MMAASTPSKRTTARKATPKITSAADWSNSGTSGIVTELPSGKTVMLVRNLDLPVMLKQGRIPNPLARVIQEMIAKNEKALPAEEVADPNVLSQMLDMVDTAVSAAMVEPKAIIPPVKDRNAQGFPITETDEAFEKRVQNYDRILANIELNTISTDWISLEDKMFIFFFSQGGAADLATFRAAAGKSMVALSASGAVEVSPE